MAGRRTLFCVISMVSIVSGVSGQVATMAYWDFGPDSAGYTEQVLIDGIAGIPTLVLQDGEKDHNGKAGLVYTDQGGTFHLAGRAGAWDNVNSCSEIIITVNTTGWWGLALRWDYYSENTVENLGPPSFDMDYRVSETGDWIAVLNNQPLIRNTAWHEFTKALIAYTAMDNEPFVQFRISDLSRQDESGGTFKIDNIELTGIPIVSSITVLTPNGGENLMAGEVSYISWTWTTDGTLDSVNLDYSVNNGASWTEIDTIANMSFYAWEVPEIPGDNSPNCLVRVSNAANPQASDTSNAVFRMFRCLLNYDLNDDCYIDLRDLALLVSEWLLCGDVLDPRCL